MRTTDGMFSLEMDRRIQQLAVKADNRQYKILAVASGTISYFPNGSATTRPEFPTASQMNMSRLLVKSETRLHEHTQFLFTKQIENNRKL